MAVYAKGKVIAFEELYRRHKQHLFLYLLRQSNNRDIGEELAHDTWLAVINGAESYQANSQFKTWLYRIAHNRLVDYWRKFGSQSPVLFEELSDQLAANVTNGTDTTINALQLEELIASLQVLSTEQRETVLLKIEGFSQSEIAEITISNKETVKSRLRYATKRMRMSAESI